MSQVITTESLSLESDAIISLFEIHTQTAIIRLCGQGTVQFGGQSYVGFPIQAEGFEFTGKGALPRPSVTIASDASIISLIQNPNQYIGMTFKRIRTYRKFLDDGASPDSNATFPIDEYVIDRKTNHTSTSIQFELCARIDQEGKRIPARQIVRDSCPYSYRRYNPAATFKFDYPTVMACPYAGTEYFDAAGNQTTIDKDRCGKKLTDCQLRFGTDGGVPFGGFPGVGRISN